MGHFLVHQEPLWSLMNGKERRGFSQEKGKRRARQTAEQNELRKRFVAQ